MRRITKPKIVNFKSVTMHKDKHNAQGLAK